MAAWPSRSNLALVGLVGLAGSTPGTRAAHDHCTHGGHGGIMTISQPDAKASGHHRIEHQHPTVSASGKVLRPKLTRVGGSMAWQKWRPRWRCLSGASFPWRPLTSLTGPTAWCGGERWGAWETAEKGSKARLTEGGGDGGTPAWFRRGGGFPMVVLEQEARGEVPGVARALGGRRQGWGGKLDGESSTSCFTEEEPRGGGCLTHGWRHMAGEGRGPQRTCLQQGGSDPRPADAGRQRWHGAGATWEWTGEVRVRLGACGLRWFVVGRWPELAWWIVAFLIDSKKFKWIWIDLIKRWPYRIQKNLNKILICRKLNKEQHSLLELFKIWNRIWIKIQEASRVWIWWTFDWNLKNWWNLNKELLFRLG
jgi:hypothetical protein